MSRFRSLPWWLVLIVPAFELTAHAWIVAHVPADSDWAAAADFVRLQQLPRDLISSAPEYTDPLLRRELGDIVPLAMAGRSDDAAYERLWVLSIRGSLPPDAPEGEPDLVREFGRVRVLRYALGRSPVLLDLVQALSSAEVSLVQGGVPRRCPRRTGGVPRGGGLGRPVLMPIAERFECDARRPWLFVGSVVMEDLDQRPRYCVWQHPEGVEPVSVRFSDVPLGDELVFSGGIYYEHERMRSGGPVEIGVHINGVQRARLTHRDGDGWTRHSIATGAPAAARGEVRIDVRAQDPAQRSFCWAASTRKRETGAAP
jgi:hypothetical protein